MVCGVVCIVYSILPLRVLLNLKQVLVLHVGKNVSVVVRGSATLSLADRYVLKFLIISVFYLKIIIIIKLLMLNYYIQ